MQSQLTTEEDDMELLERYSRRTLIFSQDKSHERQRHHNHETVQVTNKIRAQ